jgi:hypothetical protein
MILPFEALINLAFNHTTSWRFTSSAGLSGGGYNIGAGGGSLDLANTSTREEHTLRYFGAGVSIGAPAGIALSTSSMWSAGLGSIRAKTPSLSFDDLKGPMCILSAGASMVGLPDGLSGSAYFLGFPALDIVTGLIGGPITTLTNSLTAARAFGLMVGRFKGLDLSISLMTGYAY